MIKVGKTRKSLLIYSAFALILMLIVWGRLIYIQAGHFNKGLEHERKGEIKLAISEFDLAMHMYTPGSPYQDKAARRLWEIGKQHEAEGKPDWALIAYASIRSSYYASRSFYVPGKQWIERCNEKIASLDAATLGKPEEEQMESYKKRKTTILSLLKYEDAPKIWYVLCIEFAFIGWTISILYIIIKGFSMTGTLIKKEAFKGCISFVSFLIIWMIALVLV